MKSPQEAVDALCRLAAADRDWILGALSASARTKLRELTAAQQQKGAARPDDGARREPAEIPLERALMDASPALAVSRLGSEPAWVLGLVLSLRDWPWEAALLATLPPARRLEVAQLRVLLPPASARMRAALLRALSGQLSGPAGGAVDAPFEQVLIRARSRTRRRLRETGVAQ